MVSGCSARWGVIGKFEPGTFNHNNFDLRSQLDELATTHSRRSRHLQGTRLHYQIQYPQAKLVRVIQGAVLDNLAEGITVDAIVAGYPPLTADDVHACMAYAAALAHEELVPFEA